MKRFVLLAIFMLLGSVLAAQQTIVRGPYVMEVTVVGAEAAAKELAGALDRLSVVLQDALQAENLTQAERQQILDLIASIEESSVATILDDSREPLRAIVKDVTDIVAAQAADAKAQLVDPMLRKLQIALGLVLLLIACLIIAIFWFAKVYVVGMVERVTGSVDQISGTIADLSQALERSSRRLDQAD